MGWNFKDEASLARWQDDMFKKGVSYDESKKFAIDNNMTFWDWKSVKMYTWWKWWEKPNDIKFKDWAELKQIIDSIDADSLTDEQRNQLASVINWAKVWWVSLSDLSIDIKNSSPKQIDRAIKELSTDKWYEELMWYYKDDDMKSNDDIYDSILYSSELSPEAKESKLNELKKNISETRVKNLDEAWDDLGSINAALEKNKKSEKLTNKLQEWESWVLWQKKVRYNDWLNVTTTKELTKNWINQKAYNDYINEMQKIASSWDSNRKKYFDTKKLMNEWNKKLNKIEVYYNHQYGNGWGSANKWTELTNSQKKEKKMLEDYLTKWKSLTERAKAYMDSYWTYYMDLWAFN